MPSVRLILKGLIAVFVTPDRGQCIAGVLSQVPPTHTFKITFRKGVQGGTMTEYDHRDAADIAHTLKLDVQKISQQKITFRNFPLPVERRHNPPMGTEQSFSWIVDLENIELYDGPIGAQGSKFKSVLTFTNGELFTYAVSKAPLFTVRGLLDTRKFGFVGTMIGADFPLDQSGSTAVFSNGGENIPKPTDAPDWEIELNNDATAHSGIVTDANYYYTAVGLGLTEAQRILFMSDSLAGGPAGGEAACFTGFFGKSLPQG